MENSQQDHLPPYSVRPRFEIETSYSVEELVEKVKMALVTEPGIKASIMKGYLTIFISERAQHYWSPQLTMSVEETDSGSLLRGIYGPRPAVWTMFVFFYALIGFAILITSIFGFSNMTVGNSGALLWLIPLLVLVFLSLYLISYFGQRLGHDQMVELHTFVEKSIDMNII